MPYHWTQALLGEGSEILPGNYGRILLAAGYGHSSALRESILEDVRQREFNHLPSRLQCAFYFETLIQAHCYAQKEPVAFFNLYEVAPIPDNATGVHLDFRWANPVGHIGLDWAHNYWSGQPYPIDEGNHANFRETLSTCRMRIVQRLDPN